MKISCLAESRKCSLSPKISATFPQKRANYKYHNLFNWVWIFNFDFGFSFQICVFNCLDPQSSPGQANPRSCHRVFLWPARDWNRHIIMMKIKLIYFLLYYYRKYLKAGIFSLIKFVSRLIDISFFYYKDQLK